MNRMVAAFVLCCAASVARADRRPNLKIDREPAPHHLRMRSRSASASPEPRAAPVSAIPNGATNTKAATASYDAAADSAALVRDLRRPVSVRFAMGYVVDGTALTGNKTLGGDRPTNTTFNQLRAYATGEGTFSSRGVLLPSLSTYLSTSFQIADRAVEQDPMNRDRNIVIAPPIATWFDRSGFQNRSAWLEFKNFIDDPRFTPLRLRGGQLYVYGPWVLHMYGALAAWDGKLVQASAYAGSRVPDYTLVTVTRKDRSVMVGGSVRFDLRALKTPIPFAIGAELLQFTSGGATADEASGHALFQVDWRPSKDVALIAQSRTLDGKAANEHVQLRSRYKQVTNLVFDFSYRHDTDWRWDPAVSNDDPLAAKRYLDMGPVVPQAMLSARAGTLIKENVDVLVRAAVASDRVNNDAERNTYAAAFAELGGGFEVRLRRTVGLGFSALSRQTKRYATTSIEIRDMPGTPEPLPAPYSPTVGERSFTELGTSLRMSLGARRFSALVEAYGRRTSYALTYCVQSADTGADCRSALATGIPTSDTRGGGRASIEAWVGSRLRLFAAFEATSRLAMEPEISGYKSLRLMMEGVY
jgi:hypothetical protein